MNCTLCNKPITLAPSARERAARSGGKPEDYTRLFTTHPECELENRNRPLPRKPIAEIHPMFQNLELLRLRQRAAKAWGVNAGSRDVADFLNSLSEEQLLEYV